LEKDNQNNDNNNNNNDNNKTLEPIAITTWHFGVRVVWKEKLPKFMIIRDKCAVEEERPKILKERTAAYMHIS